MHSTLEDLDPKLAADVMRETMGERIAWVGQPDPKLAAKLGMLAWLVAVPWLYLAVRWEAACVGAIVRELGQGQSAVTVAWLTVLALWGLPLVAAGLAIMAAPYWAWLRARATAHVITDKRVLTIKRRRGNAVVVRHDPARMESVTCAQQSSGRGNIQMVLGKAIDADGVEAEVAETFWWVPDAERAERLIEGLRGRSGLAAA